MGAEHSSALTFNLEETVWLDKSQNMKELLSLGLEPDIHIEEKADYVAIKGGLHLRGEYTKEEEERDETQAETPAPQYAEENKRTEEGIGEIKHFFPVDVTIPLHRIHNLDDVYVQIEGFDYDLPEPGCIQLTADVSISGMKKEEQPSPNDTKAEVVSAPDPMPRYDMEAFAEPNEDPNQEYSSSEERTFRDFSSEQDKQEPVASNSEPFERENEVKDNPREEAEETPEVREENQEEVEEVEEKEKEEASTPIVTSFQSRPSSQAESTMEEERPEETEAEEETEIENESTEEEDDSESTSGRYDNALYLTKVMTQGEDEFSRIKMCIIQENESLDTIAERYGTTINHLLRFNRLDNEHVEEGQILYIPASAAGHKKHEQ